MVSLTRRLRHLVKLPGRCLKATMVWLLRVLMISNRPDRLAKAGFVLPTTVMLVLVLTLTTGALTYRSLSRSNQVIAQREQQVIKNAATPAIDRAKAKIEYMFQRDRRIPGGLPSSDYLKSMMADDGQNTVSQLGQDVYTLPDETRIDIDGDPNTEDNAWFFRTDLDGDGNASDDEIIAYTVLMDDAVDTNGDGDTSDNADIRLTDAESKTKAESLVTRTGPLSASKLSNQCASARAPEGGWQIVNASEDLVQKNFQVTAFVMKRGTGGEINRTVDTLEFQQSREANRGSKWGAWFDYDLEVYPGPEFKWNGAMHTESNLFVQDNFKGYMVSSNDSCIYSQTASEITINEDEDPDIFQGQLVRGAMRSNDFTRGNNTPEFHIYDGPGAYPRVGANGLRLDDNANTASERDSVQAESGQNPTLYDIAVNPITLFTQGLHRHMVAKGTTWNQDPDWEDSDVVAQRRIYNKREREPFVDDFYRADDRWGPNPTYRDYDIPAINNGTSENFAQDTNVKIGAEIDGSTYQNLEDGEGLDGFWERQAIGTGLRLIISQRLELGNHFGWNYDPIPEDGVTETDPLYPANESKGYTTAPPTTTDAENNAQRLYPGGIHEVLQRRTLRDNLAAVQSMAVYHYETNSGEFPAACVALTAHPGTQQTIINSRTFNTLTSPTGTPITNASGVQLVEANFLEGIGTNGWEFTYPDDGTTGYDTEAKFELQVESTTSPLGKALRNLAKFAGDPLGGAPSFVPTQDTNVHPFPEMAMWGDYAELRLILDKLDASGGDYQTLSPADKTTLHTAACTIGLLAYNLNTTTSTVTAALADTGINWSTLGTKIVGIIDNNQITNGNPIIGRPANGSNLCTATGAGLAVDGCPAQNPHNVTDPASPEYPANYFAEFSTDEWINALGGINPALTPDEQEALRIVIKGSQILRDRTLGFSLLSNFTGDLGGDGDYDPTTGLWTNPDTGEKVESGRIGIGSGQTSQFIVGCDPDLFQSGALSSGSAKARLGLALVTCSTSNPPKYVSLYYTFPVNTHDRDGATAGIDVDDTQPAAEQYISEVVPYEDATAAKTFDALTGTDIANLALINRNADLSDWVLPHGSLSSAGVTLTNPDEQDNPATTSTNESQQFRIVVGGNDPDATTDDKSFDVAFLDKGMYDGREQMSLRILDVDINRLVTDTNVADTWLSDDEVANGRGIVYAFREDAVREDEIVRPKNGTVDFATCTALNSDLEFGVESNADCRMIVNPGSSTFQDPPLSAVGISVKPVDFYPDPDRRPFGFRFQRGDDFSNAGSRSSGMTFVSDNSVYILGNFNLHQDSAGDSLEEFTDKLEAINNWGADDFYSNGNGPAAGRDIDELNDDNFAVLDQDYWRPVEILADSIGILSDDFRDGSIADTFGLQSPTADGGGTSSYQNQSRPFWTNNASTSYCPQYWVRENGPDGRSEGTATCPTASGDFTDDLITPVWVSRNGEYKLYRFDQTPPFTSHPSALTNWTVGGFVWLVNAERRLDNLQTASATTVNATFISGIVPSRPFQPNGGLHNFPRLNEYWDGVDLNIAGAFLQLNFSTAGTGPFDQDAWEPGQLPIAESGGEANVYRWFYDPPERNWGYDVGLQYVPPAPVSERFTTFGSPRSEYYRELPVDDVYVNLLRCAEYDNNGNTERIDPQVDAALCPDS